MKKIFEYNNYRLYLQDYFVEKKKTTGFFTHRYFAALAGFSSPVFIKLVIDGKSKLSVKSIPKISAALGLNISESRYFEELVFFNQEKSFKKKKELWEKLRILYHDFNVNVLDAEQYDFYAKWYHGVIREIIPHCKGSLSEKELAKTLYPAITAGEVKKAISLLLKLGLIRENNDGSYTQSAKLISTGSEFDSLAVRQLHSEMSTLATSAIENVPKEERDISGLTIGVSMQTLEKIKKEIENLRSKIMDMVVSDTAVDQVYRLNLQLFPVSKKLHSETRKKP